MLRLFVLALIAGSLALASPASSAGVHYVTVINFLSAPAKVTLLQFEPVGTKTIYPRYEHTFDIPPGHTTLVVTSTVCGEKRTSLPTEVHLRVHIYTGCVLSLE